MEDASKGCQRYLLKHHALWAKTSGPGCGQHCIPLQPQAIILQAVKATLDNCASHLQVQRIVVRVQVVS